jgi:hypothetical protein
MSINFVVHGTIDLLETYINNVFAMFENVIGGYIIKSATENALKITMSVLSDYVEKKYGTSLIKIEHEDEDIEINDFYCESGVDEDTYDDLVEKELQRANINTQNSDDDSDRFNNGMQVVGASDKEEEVKK